MPATIVPVTLYQCFQQTHQVSMPYIRPRTVDEVKAHQGEVTKNLSAPKYSTRKSIDHWAQKGYAYARDYTRALDQQRLSAPESAMYHKSEADVVRAATLYLLHPVNQAFCADRSVRSTIRCLSEAPEAGVRCDVVFRRTSNNPSTKVMRTFALLECKKRGTILMSDFRAAEQVVSETNTDADIRFRAQKRLHASYFSGNAVTLIKQAGSYACRYGIRHVAIFDWDHLVLVKFVMVKPELSKADRAVEGMGTTCEVAIIPARDSHSMHPALLGFLDEAHRETLFLPSDEPDRPGEFDEEEG